MTGKRLQGFGLGGNLAVDFAVFLENIPTNSRGDPRHPSASTPFSRQGWNLALAVFEMP